MRAPHGASADHKPASLAFALVAQGSDRRTRENVAGPNEPAALFQESFHKECVMSFAKNIWPGVDCGRVHRRRTSHGAAATKAKPSRHHGRCTRRWYADPERCRPGPRST